LNFYFDAEASGNIFIIGKSDRFVKHSCEIVEKISKIYEKEAKKHN